MKVLIVDDHAYNRELLSMMVGDCDYDYCMATNGQEAVNLVCEDIDIDLVLMDVNMPVMDGMAATAEIKKRCKDRFVPVIFVTALDDEEALAECLAIGGEDFIPKPINENVLIAKMQAHKRTLEYHKELKSSHERLSYHRRVMDRDHKIVEKVFRNSMRRLELNCENVNFHVSPATMFNGDLLLIARSPVGSIFVLLGDFTGHGLSAAVGCMPVSDIFYGMVAKRAGVSAIVTKINAKLQEILPSNMFFCATLLELDASGERLTIWSGGMNDILLVDDNGNITNRIQACHMPLGILEQSEFDDSIDVVSPVTSLRAYVYTDGIVEARNGAGEFFSEQRFEALLQQTGDSRVDSIAREIDQFHDGCEQADDISLVEVLCRPITFKGEKSAELSGPKSAKLSGAFTGVLPWQIELVLGPQQLRNGDVIGQIVRLLASFENADSHRDILFTLVSELFNNALEHGLLNLDSTTKDEPGGFERYYQLREQRLANLQEGQIILRLQVDPGSTNKLRLTLTDTGAGFDTEKLNRSGEAGDISFARGVGLVRSLCEDLQYSDGGRTATITYPLH